MAAAALAIPCQRAAQGGVACVRNAAHLVIASLGHAWGDVGGQAEGVLVLYAPRRLPELLLQLGGGSLAQLRSVVGWRHLCCGCC